MGSKNTDYKITQFKLNPNNPRIVKDENFKRLVKSITEFPEMMEKRPMVCVTDVDGVMFPLGGNMRLKAIKELKMKTIPENWFSLADEWNEEKRREFLIKDNVSVGDWDWEALREWDVDELEDWGLDVPSFAPDVDYSILDDDDDELTKQTEAMTSGVKKAIQIEFESEHYEDAYALVKFWREQGAYIGGMIMENLKFQKDSL
jgi:hypothetical protein